MQQLRKFRVLNAFIDARTVPAGTVLEPDLAIVGGGPAGISLALALANTPIRMVLLESGGMTFDAKTQALYQGTRTGAPYVTLDASRLRYLGGSTNHWGGWSRPLDEIDFEERTWLPHSGWPFKRKEIERYFPHAQALCEVGPFIYDKADHAAVAMGPLLPLGPGGVATRWFQFSKMRGSVLPTHFGDRYAEDLKRISRLSVYLHANVTRLGMNANGAKIEQLDVATLTGRKFKIKPKITVLAVGAIENARLLLASNDVIPAGVGNTHDMVGRFFADHPIPRDTATLVLFGGAVAPYYTDIQTIRGAIMRAGLFPTEEFRRSHAVMGSSITIENKTELDDLGKAALAATAAALGIAPDNAQAYSLGCGLEITPDPDRRLTLGTDDRRAWYAQTDAPHENRRYGFRTLPPDLERTGAPIARVAHGLAAAEFENAQRLAGWPRLGQPSHGNDAHACRSAQRRGRRQFAGSRRAQSVRCRKFDISELWRLESDYEPGSADAETGRSFAGRTAMTTRFSRRNILIASGSAALVLGAGYEGRRLWRKHYAPSPYDDLLAKLDNRDADAQLGEAVLGEIDDFDPKTVAAGLRAKLEHKTLEQSVAEDVAAGRVIEANGWVLPETLALLCALAAKAQ